VQSPYKHNLSLETIENDNQAILNSHKKVLDKIEETERWIKVFTVAVVILSIIIAAIEVINLLKGH
jgi:hypothetical protein